MAATAALAPGGREYHFEDLEFTFPLTTTGLTLTPATTLAAATVGYAVSVDTGVVAVYGQPCQVKLAADGDEIFGRIETVENRAQDGLGVLVTVALAFVGSLPLKTGETPAAGATLVGAGNGTVKTRPAIANAGSGFLPVPGAAKQMAVYAYDGTNHFVNVAFGV